MPGDPGETGIHAYIVHDLKKEYVASYIFSGGTEKEISIKMSARCPVGEVGSYSSYVHIDDTGSIQFTGNDYTIWQDSANNPYTALSTPVEETFHILLRRYTENAIRSGIEDGHRSAQELQEIVEDWISVEEAVVGGLVNVLLPPVLEKNMDDFPEILIENDLREKSKFKKYRYLRKGIRIVREMGYKKSLEIYRTDPKEFRNLLL